MGVTSTAARFIGDWVVCHGDITLSTEKDMGVFDMSKVTSDVGSN